MSGNKLTEAEKEEIRKAEEFAEHGYLVCSDTSQTLEYRTVFRQYSEG